MHNLSMKNVGLSLGIALLSVAATSVYGAETPRRIEIVAKKFEYVPAEITVKKGEPVVLVFTSEDVPHGLKVKELNLVADISKKGTSEAAFTPTVAGDFVGQCSHFCGMGHGRMKLIIHVSE